MFLVYNEKKVAHEKNGRHRLKKIAYFSIKFPKYTETLAYREFLHIKDLGVQMSAFCLKKELPGPIPNEAMPLLEVTKVLRRKNILYRIFIQVIYAFFHPVRYLKTIFLQFFETSFGPFAKLQGFSYFLDGVVLGRILLKEKIDHIHIHHGQAEASIGLVAHRLTQIPYSLTFYGKDAEKKNSQLQAKLKNAEFVICHTEAQKISMLENFPKIPAEKFHVIRPGVDLEIFIRIQTPKEQMFKFRLITVSQLFSLRNFELILRSCKILDSRGMDFEALIIGEGREKSHLQSMTNELRLNQRIRFSGARRMEEIIDAMAHADLFVLPMLNKKGKNFNFIPVSMIEAMAMELPVITSDTRAVRELVDESTGRLIEEPDPVLWADVIEELLTHTYLRIQLGKAARRRVEQDYNLEKNVRVLAELFSIDIKSLAEFFT